jgi:hypothetical protein
MKKIFINSMSRTGTSLLYQLLYGHQELAFFPPRIQFACSSPAGFPYILDEHISNDDFINILIGKTTIAVNTTETTRWHNIDIVPIRKALGDDCMHRLITRFKQIHTAGIGKNNVAFGVETYIETLYSALSLESEFSDPRKKGLVLHDDHLYVLGVNRIADHDPTSYFVQTVRHPLDLVASRKNMLVYHLGENRHPSEYELKREVIEAETIRAVWSLIASALNRETSGGNYTVLAFEHLRTEAREKAMRLLSDRLELNWTEALLEEHTGSNEKWCNELVFAGSTLNYLTKGKENTRVGAAKSVLTKVEQEYVTNIISDANIDDLFSTEPLHFENKIADSVESLASLHKTLRKWKNDYHSDKFFEIWDDYSALNYGMSRATESFNI